MVKQTVLQQDNTCKDNEEDDLIIDDDVDNGIVQQNAQQPAETVTQQLVTVQGAQTQPANATTSSGRTVRAPTRLPEEMEATAMDEASEIMAVGAGIGGGFVHTSKLKPVKCEEAIAKDPVGRGKAVDNEHERMKSHAVFKAVSMDEVPKNAKTLTSTWAMKQKADGTLRAQVTARGHEQKPGQHHEETGNARATSVRLAFVRELKEAGISKIEWIQEGNNSADLHTKNLNGPEHDEHVSECEDVASVADESNTREEECQDKANKNGVTGTNGGTQGTVPPQGLLHTCVDGG